MVDITMWIHSRVSINVECCDRIIANKPYPIKQDSSHAGKGSVREWIRNIRFRRGAKRSKVADKRINFRETNKWTRIGSEKVLRIDNNITMITEDVYIVKKGNF